MQTAWTHLARAGTKVNSSVEYAAEPKSIGRGNERTKAEL